ncbi:MAG TPA: hypothetical protein VFE82_16165 [Ramlibacter sp.]|jgi:hypothetical protein|uniref:hypothetical protein n=1 Tax=Ramlibacter sp. TaxID=1917967 RepID=UPI002D409E2F|nr:hypothetical protein [Ramlibacter sp.]HZY20007.1 hypothetical protein [Ramlibacter sp.]
MREQESSKQPVDAARKQAAAPGETAAGAQARHGYRNEVTWEGGSGRQPYSNQGRRETPSPAAGHEVAEGNRGARSGTNLDQLERVKSKP